MNSNSVFAETKKERQFKELAFLSILYFCVTVAIVTLMTLIYDVISTGYSRLFNDYELGLISKVTIDNPRDFLTSLDSRDPLKAGIGPAFAGTLTDEATRGMNQRGLLARSLRLGMNPATIRTASKFLGLPGLALSLGYEGYDQYKKYTEGRGFVYNLLNKDE